VAAICLSVIVAWGAALAADFFAGAAAFLAAGAAFLAGAAAFFAAAFGAGGMTISGWVKTQFGRKNTRSVL
jgi:hypothetical protein